MAVPATFAAVYGAFAKFDDIQSEANRSFVRDWLLGMKVDDQRWANFFTELFTKFFGAKHWSAKCVRRSFALSFTLIVAVCLLWFARDVKTGDYIGDLLFVVPAVLFGCLTDYFSLWKTRFILTRTNWFTDMRIATVVVLFDVLATTILFYAALFFTMLVLLAVAVAIFGDELNPEWGALWGILKRHWNIFAWPQRVSLPIVPLYFAALLTSAWLWVYLIVAYGMRAMSQVPPLLNRLSKVLDFSGHPVRSIGYVAAAVSAIIVGVGTLLIALV